MNKIKISAIVPVFNSEECLARCINSILAQDFKDFEIILINDGSTDTSGSIINKYIKRYNFIKACTLEVNKGVSYARNQGIDMANGEYVVFIDSDDYIMSDMFNRLYNDIVTQTADVSICNVIRISGDKIVTQSHSNRNYSINFKKYSKNDYITSYMLTEKHKYCVWNRIYSRKIINDYSIRFYPNSNIYPEDLLFNLQYLIYSNKITWNDKLLYTHITRKNSITKKFRENIFFRYMNLCKEYCGFLKENDLYREYMESYFNIVIEQFFNAITATVNVNNENLLHLYKMIKYYSNQQMTIESFYKIDNLKGLRYILVWMLRNKIIGFSSFLIYFLLKIKVIRKI